MAYDTQQFTAPSQRARSGLRVRTLALFLLWVAIASSSFVIQEPAPYDFLMASMLVILPLAGLADLNRRIGLFLALWLIVGAGGIIATTQAGLIPVPGRHVGISVFLSLSAVVIACAVYREPQRITGVIMSGLTIAAVSAAILACLGYFDVIPGARELFTKFDRAKAAFKDPNVYGAFLVPVLVYALHRMASAKTVTAVVQMILAGIICVGLLVSYSRGAWFQATLATMTYAVVAFLASRTDAFRLRLFVFVLLGGAGAALGFLALLQVDAVADLLNKRASLALGYDMGPQGRFGGQLKALDLITRHPAGIGALEFSRSYHHEDVHNIYLSMFLNAGWIGGFGYLGLVVATLLTGLLHSLRRTQHQGLMLVMFASFVGVAAEGLIIDSDHWRHFYVVMGIIWGLAAANDGLRGRTRMAWRV